MKDTLNDLLQRPWVSDLALIILIVIAFNFGIKRFLNALKRRFDKKNQLWRASFVEALYTPLSLYVWVFAIFSIIVIIDRTINLEPLIKSNFLVIPLLAAILGTAWFLFRWKSLAIKTMTEKKSWEKIGLNPQRVDAIDKLLTLIIFFFIAAWLLEATGHGVGTLLTIGGIGAAAIGFAAKDLIANFFGGLMIYINTPFKTGDLIKIPGKDTTGHVEEIGWYMTRVRDLEKQTIYIPNSMFSQFIVVNISGRTHRRILEKVGIRYDNFSSVTQIIKEFQEYLDGHESLNASLPRFAAFTAFNDSSLDITVMAYSNVVKRDAFLLIKQELLFKLHEIVTNNNASFAYPTMTIRKENR